ncbi:hypothetical protein [Haloarchaeobius amylolyticus]|uniref:hypothetical protein n=1 Tax=Haloarchaeobius amylolyticus TaxID=1198296 RepID=UPI00227182C8|nr:hypothetical protein [Haloarchaeobius amylolyticus]
MTDAAQRTRAEFADQFEETLESLRDRIDDLEARTAELEAENEQLREENQRLQERNEDLSKRVTVLESQPTFEVGDDSDPIKSLRVEGAPIGKAIQSKPGMSDVEGRIEELKNEIEEMETGTEVTDPDTGEHYRLETPLEHVTVFSEEAADQFLGPNQDRARFLANNIRTYATSIPAGWAVSTSTMLQMLAAYDGSDHRETVRRVREIFDDFGRGETRIVERRGSDLLILTDELFRRLDRLDGIESSSHSVVTVID